MVFCAARQAGRRHCRPGGADGEHRKPLPAICLCGGERCQLFSISCISGKFNPGLSVAEGLHLGGMSVGVLTAAIGHFMNYGKEAAWRPVRGWDRKSLGLAEDGGPVETDNAYSSVLGRYANGAESHRSDPSFYAKWCEKIIGRESEKGGCFAPVCSYLRVAATAMSWIEGTVGLSGKEGEVREKYEEFCDWYETSPLPAILNERAS